MCCYDTKNDKKIYFYLLHTQTRDRTGQQMQIANFHINHIKNRNQPGRDQINVDQRYPNDQVSKWLNTEKR